MKKETYIQLLPKRTHCTDNPKHGMVSKFREQAVEYSHIQANPETSRCWLLFDGDVPDAYFLPEERGLPTPTYIAVNPDNSRAHIGYQLESPVTFSGNAREGPMKFFLAVERGFTRRLGADMGYSHHLTKNPVHPRWIVDWQAKRPWRLDELNDCLEPHEKRWAPKLTEGVGRNCTMFEVLRKTAYCEVLKFKKDNGPYEKFRDFLKKCADDTNATFIVRLGECEVRGLVKSVANWAWRTFTFEKFSAIQACRVARRWHKDGSPPVGKPWLKEGISRATYYRRRNASA